MSGQWNCIRNIIAAGLITALFLFFTSSVYAQCTNLGTDGLVAHWKLDETSSGTIADSADSNTGSWLDGSGNSVAEETGPGQLGTALTFDGSNDRIDLSDPAALQITGPMSVSLWVNLDTADAGTTSSLFTRDGGLSDRGYRLNFEPSGMICFMVAVDATNKVEACSPSSTAVPEQWMHLVGTYEPSKAVKLYIDGAVNTITTASVPASIRLSTAGPFIGQRGNNGERFGGELDDVRIYDRALSAPEIAALYAQRSNDPPTEGTIGFSTKYAQMVYCDGTNWKMMGLGSYNPNAVSFDRTSDYLKAAYGGPADPTLVTGSFWYNLHALSGGTTQDILDVSDAGTSTFRFRIRFNGASTALLVDGKQNNGTSTTFINTGGLAVDGWHHVMFSLDITNTARQHFYLDDVDTSSVLSTTLTEIGTTGGSQDWAIGGAPNGSQKLDADLADLWVDFDTYIDLSIEANRRKFISGAGMPKYLGPDGSIPTGTAPEIFLTGDTATWHTSKGTGGGFTENGALTNATNQPIGSIEVYWDTQCSSWGDAYYFDSANSKCYYYESTAVGGWNAAQIACRGHGGYLATIESAEEDAIVASIVADGLETYYGGYDGNIGEWRWYDKYGNPGIQFWSGASGGAAVPSVYNNFRAGQPNSNSQDCITASATSPYDEWVDADCGLSARYVCEVDVGCIAGMVEYSSNFNVMQYCNGIEWVAMGPTGGTPPTNGLVGHWQLDEITYTSAADSSGNGNHGSLVNGLDPTSDSVSGVVGTALNFDGNDDAIVMANDFYSAVFTVTAWVWRDPAFTNEDPFVFYGIVSKWSEGCGGGQNDDWHMGIEEGNYDYWVETAGGCYQAVGPYMPFGVWTHIAMTYDGETLLGYADGEQVAINTGMSGNTNNGIHSPVIGSNRFSGTLEPLHFFKGKIDDVRIYDRALSPQEIEQLYHYGLSGGLGDVSGNCTSPDRPEGVMLYNFDHGYLQYCNGERWIGIGK